ncbi:MAG: LysR family transcriptional regulator [Azospirillaceae bacterium]|nr:LysR family transcriptional regulator [Azospirillaceae bacterium]
MVRFDRRWLPLNALRAFEAVGRHLSFTAAAHALNVSQGAISRHVINLEKLLGRPLFERKPQMLVLTKAGAALLPIVRGSFDRMEQALNDIVREGGGRKTLRLQLPPSFAQKLALPILQGFRKDFPDIFVDFSSLGFTGLPRTDTDVAVIYDRPTVGDAITDLLWMNRVAPTCSPALARRHAGKTMREFIAANELLHVKLEGEPPGVLWEAYSRHYQLNVDSERGLAFDTAILAAQYAQGGEGVALLDIDLFADDIAAGRLVTPFEATFEDGYGYYLNFQVEDLADPVIAVFRSWMIRHFAGIQGRIAVSEPGFDDPADAPSPTMNEEFGDSASCRGTAEHRANVGKAFRDTALTDGPAMTGFPAKRPQPNGSPATGLPATGKAQSNVWIEDVERPPPSRGCTRTL